MQKLVSKYENRMREFVFKMAEKPVVIKKSKDKFLTTRQEFFALTSDKILHKKGFQFKSYKSDKERIQEFLKGKESILNQIFPQKEEPKENKDNNLKEKEDSIQEINNNKNNEEINKEKEEKNGNKHDFK